MIGWIGVQLVDLNDQFFLRNAFGKQFETAFHANLGSGFLLLVDI